MVAILPEHGSARMFWLLPGLGLPWHLLLFSLFTSNPANVTKSNSA